MSSKFGDMSKSRRVNSQDDNFWNSRQNSSVGKFFPQKYLASSNKKKLTPMLGIQLFIYLMEFDQEIL